MAHSHNNTHTPCSSTFYIDDEYTYVDFVRKRIHLSSVKLEHGMWARLWLKTKSQETRMLAYLQETSPKVALNMDVHFGDQLYVECDYPALVALVGCMPGFDHYNATFYLKDCFISISAPSFRA